MDWQKYLSQFDFSPEDLLVIVDMQVDFKDGPMGTKRAIEIAPGIVALIEMFPGQKAYTKDTHDANGYLQTQEGKAIPILHTIVGTDGWQLVPEIGELVTDQDIIIEKSNAGSAYLFGLCMRHHYRKVWFVGVCTDYCVIANAVAAKTADSETEIHVIEPLCGGKDKQSHDVAIEAMKLLLMHVHGTDG